MVDGGNPDNMPRRDQLLEEASIWFARMRGPDAEQHRAAFEAWLTRGAVHLSAYNRAGEIFALGRFLEHEAQEASREEEPRPVRWRGYALAASIVLMIGVSTWFGRDLLASLVGLNPGRPAAPLMASTGTERWTAEGNRRTIRLADGSFVTLDDGSALTAHFNAQRRELRLERGRARFDVAHDGRPFIVFAGDGSVTARGTIFDVIINRDQLVTVRLLRGAVDVERPASGQGKSKAAAQAITRLVPGEILSFGRATIPDLATPAKARGLDAVASMPQIPAVQEFDKATLSAVVAEANRGSTLPIRIADPAVGALTVSGRFRVDDPEQVADRLASLFDLQIDRARQNEIVLRSRSSDKKFGGSTP